MLRSVVQVILQRELAALRRSVEAYPDDASIWAERPGLPNPGGTLVLHLAGNLQHYLGVVLGQSGYRRDREAEFARRGVTLQALLEEIDAARVAVDLGFANLTAETVRQPFPELIAGRSVVTSDYLVHLASHLAYHLGQLDYHRRCVTGDPRSIGALAPAELPGPKSKDEE
ncbi:MAG: DinB family protein [Gemmatimonadota bacterium]|nr:DinB family protein [Gemmatimonadota bacterium]